MENGFPVTKLYTNPELQQNPQFKQQVIREILQTKTPDLVLFFGDNGQFDAQVYGQLTSEFQHIPSLVYIREAYSKLGEAKYPTQPGQIGFVTTLELVIDLIQRDLLPEQSLPDFEKIVVEKLKREDGNELFEAVVLPWWMDCRDFRWLWHWPRPSAAHLFIKDRLIKRCSNEP
jgi:hypothetical protein